MIFREQMQVGHSENRMAAWISQMKTPDPADWAKQGQSKILAAGRSFKSEVASVKELGPTVELPTFTLQT
jgi:hypothetical protein